MLQTDAPDPESYGERGDGGAFALSRLRLAGPACSSGGASPHNRSWPSLMPACKMSIRGYFVRSRRGHCTIRLYLPALQAGRYPFASLTVSMQRTRTVSLGGAKRVVLLYCPL